MVFLTFRYRLYPDEEQQEKTNGWLEPLRLLERVSNRRKDFLHKTSRHLVASHEGLALG
jgi:transposase